MNKKLIISIVTVLVIGIAGVAWWQNKPTLVSKYTGPVETIRLALTKSGLELSSLIYIADAQEYFKEEGLNVEITQETNGVAAQRKVATGDADIAVDSDFGFVNDSFTVDNLRILASIDRPKVIDIVARKDRGINSPADLRGKKIGFTSKLATEFFLVKFLITNNIQEKEVSIVDMPLSDQQNAIVSGEVDAVSTNEPYTYDIKTALGENAISWGAQGDQDFSWLVISSSQFLKNNGEAAARFLKSLLSAENFLKANPEGGKQIIRDMFAKDQDYFDQNWPKQKFAIVLDQSLLITMEDEARFVIANKSTNQIVIPNYLNFIYFDALTKIKPEAVTIIH